MIQLTKDTDLSRLSLRFVAGEDDVRQGGESTTDRERWVLQQTSGGFGFNRFPAYDICHDIRSETRQKASERFLSKTALNTVLYSFQSEEEMNQWLNSPFK